MTPVRATLRLQLHAGYTLHDAAGDLDYFAQLGVSHLYLSPVGCAVPGSTHGYDGTDPTAVNPELGGDAALRALSAQARTHGMGLVLDIVPNHMATHADNRWWWDVLAHGQSSAFAHWFDINWRAPLAEGRVVLPLLDRPLPAALADGVLTEDDSGAAPRLLHHDTPLPLTNADTAEPDLGARIAAQAYLLLWWRQGDARINYRRFFTISTLVALQVQHPDVFAAVHRLPLSLLAEGVIDGLRVDHVDGLADPQAYLQQLRSAMDAATPSHAVRPPLWVEKILAPGETLPAAWHCDGTTGYDFMDQVAALLHHGGGVQQLAGYWQHSTGQTASFADAEQRARREVLATGLRSECDALLRLLARLDRAAPEPTAGPWGRALLARALTALLVHFPVYRSYATTGRCDAQDTAHWATALAGVAETDAEDTVRAARWIAACFHDPEPAGRLRRAQPHLRRRFQQLSAPLNAKAVEDRAFYRHGVLLSRNEVGSRPDHAALAAPAFHAQVQARAAQWPNAMLATATHDHKRGEDSRARLAVLSERPAWWARQVQALDRGAAQVAAPVPAAVRWMLWQSLLGAWPLATRFDAAAFAARIGQWQVKALREGDEHSSWTDPDAAMEDAVQALIDTVLLSPAGTPLRDRLQRAAAAVAVPGARNGLAQTVLRLTVPGIPDTYQGTDGWDLSLVDPDNRRPVDTAQRRHWLADTRPWAQLLAGWQDGAVKARLIRRLLQWRAAQPALFASGDYQPRYPDRDVPLLAFTRTLGAQRLLVAVARHTAHSPLRAGLAVPDAHWRGARLPMPAGRYINLLTGAVFHADGTPQRLRCLFQGSPVAIYATC